MTENKDALWVLIMLKNQIYAIDSSYVDSIVKLEQKPIRLPDSDDTSIGIIDIRGNIVSLLDLRSFFGLENLEREQQRFLNMLEQRKADHINWVNELKRCLAEGEPFSLATDPHLCAFGKWFDNYEPENRSIAFALSKIDEPHRKLHQSAEHAFSCNRDCNNCKNEECLQTVLRRETEIYMQQVLGCLEDVKSAFADSYKKMCIVLSNGNDQIGVVVDEVVAVESLVDFTESNFTEHDNPLVSSIAQRREENGQVLVINLNRLF